MSVILAFATACVLVIWGLFHKTKTSKAAKPVFVERYIHPGHTWMRMTEDGDTLVGIDDFAQSLIGTIEAIQLPRLLKRVEQGNVAWFVKHNNRVVPMVSPVSGRVIEKNEMVLNNPLLINTSPYGEGWLLRIRPSKLKPQLQNLLTGKTVSHWQEMAKHQLNKMFSGTPALMFQDGGVLIGNFADRCSDEEWDALKKEFFLVQ
ncbi:MAG: glycine cleavage system protein H [Bacteroidota bacterium]